MNFLLYPPKYQLDPNILLETTSEFKIIFLLLQTAIIDKKNIRFHYFAQNLKLHQLLITRESLGSINRLYSITLLLCNIINFFYKIS